jgi:ABC-2 type transport system permease protein
LLFVASLVGAWLLSFFVSASIGALAFFMESSVKVTDVWLAVFFVFSGYLIPVALFPARIQAVLDYLPFRYQVGLPVELATGVHGRAEALALVGRQWIFVLAAGLGMRALWQRGFARFSAYGG